ncbi:hypothetical protein LNP04_12280 [Chryseobacterium sp. C-71]|uniref:hypothetical protein n=1 Tax=Chryseobacterium sp. C-71 TaxID=2893882 RepID=UPI001E2F0224|nr:hypothetical protein [Chryseobacterium sp. C-71]UFH30752.1 hypothetical protein LNP04_12280 [Chryseobacterium sp. C-71]
MPKRLITELKEYFKAGKRPTQSQFADFLESYAHLDGPQLARITDNINTENGYLRLRGMDNAVVAQISLQDIRNNMGIPNSLVQSVNGQTGNVTLDLEGPTDVGSTREGIAKYFTANHSATDIFHIKLPYRVTTDRAMYHIKASGYAYGAADIIDVTWVGYCYAEISNITNNKTGILNSTAITAGQYVGSDSHVYLWFKLPSIYFSSFKLDSMRVGNGGLITSSDVQILVSSQTQL